MNIFKGILLEENLETVAKIQLFVVGKLKKLTLL